MKAKTRTDHTAQPVEIKWSRLSKEGRGNWARNKMKRSSAHLTTRAQHFEQPNKRTNSGRATLEPRGRVSPAQHLVSGLDALQLGWVAWLGVAVAALRDCECACSLQSLPPHPHPACRAGPGLYLVSSRFSVEPAELASNSSSTKNKSNLPSSAIAVVRFSFMIYKISFLSIPQLLKTVKFCTLSGFGDVAPRQRR